jgi:hypothetical protein
MSIPESVLRIFETNKVLKSPLRIFELPHPNVGNYSPTKTVRTKTAKQTILAMSQPDFDGRQTVVTNDVSLPDDLVPAEGAVMTVRLGGVALSASSTGQSVVVLPVQFSHCWRIVSGSDATLFRANLMQLGVLFSGELRLELRQIFGPFGDSACRVKDATDATQLRMLDAAGTVADENKPAGDGLNLIPGAGALDQVFDHSSIASIKAVKLPNASVPAYMIAAEGERTQHYLALDLPKLTPGVYTLSMQVRAKDSRFMGLQMKDGADNDVSVDYLPSQRQVWIIRKGAGASLDATVRAVDDEWFQTTLTSTLSTETGNRIFIHLKDKGNHDIFVPRGQAITIRAIKLERGEKATPSQEFSANHAGTELGR